MKPPSESEKTNPNKANFKIGKMNLNSVKSMDYVKKRDWTLGENKPNTKPIQAQTKPKQTQNKANSGPNKPNPGAPGHNTRYTTRNQPPPRYAIFIRRLLAGRDTQYAIRDTNPISKSRKTTKGAGRQHSAVGCGQIFLDLSNFLLATLYAARQNGSVEYIWEVIVMEVPNDRH